MNINNIKKAGSSFEQFNNWLGWNGWKRFLLLAGLLISGGSTQAAALSYAGTSGLPIGNSMSGSAYGNGAYVIVGTYGNILRSTDGTNWVVVKNSTFINTNYGSVAFAQGIFVAVAANGNIITSADGANWSFQTSGTANALNKIAYLNGKFFVTGSAGTLLSSANGTNWSVQSLGSTNTFQTITYGAGKYLMASYAGNGYIFSSTTGTGSWTSARVSSSEYNPVNFVGYLNGQFWALTSDALMWKSTDGATWTQFTSSTIPYPNMIFGGIYTNSTYYFYGSDTNGTYGAIFTSTDGSNFSEYLPKTFTDVVNSLLYANGLFVATGNGGFVTSPDAIHWRYPAGGYTSVAYNGTNYVVVGGVSSDGYITTSPDWVNWTNTTPGRLTYLNSVVYGKGKFVAIGASGNGLPYSIFVSSPDGYNWTVTNSGTADTFYSVATDSNGVFVVVGDNGHIMRSADNGVSWSTVTSGTANGLNAVNYINSQFVAVGYAGTVVYSANGTSWANADYSADVNSSLTGITYGPGGYVLVGVDGNYNSIFLKRSSLTTGSWAAPTTPPPSVSYSYYGGLMVTYAGGVYMGFYNDTNNEAYLLTSSDGNTWVQNDLHDTSAINGITYAAGSYRLVGYYDYKGRASFSNSAPVIQAVFKQFATNTTLSFTNGDFNRAAVYSDTNSDPLAKIQILTLPSAAAGTLRVQGIAIQANQEISATLLSAITFVPVTNYGGTATFTWQASDGLAYSTSAIYTLSSLPANTAPVFVGSTTNLLIGQNAGATDLKSLLHVSDTDASQTETWSQSSAPSHGTLTFTSATAASGSADITPGGTITYAPTAGYSGADSFVVQVSDGNGGTAVRGISVTINPPTGITSANTASGTYGSAFSYTITASNSPTAFGAVGLPTGLTLNGSSGLISGTLHQSGTVVVTLSATNATSYATASLTLTLTQANITVSGIIASNKVYDGTATAALGYASAALNGVISGDSITLNTTAASATFADANVGTGKTVTITGLALAGTMATNYTLTQPTATASITAAPATVIVNRSVQLYNGSPKSVTNATVPGGLSVAVTYNGSSTAPSSVGAYTVVGTVTSANYTGSATNYLYIAVAPQYLKVYTNGANIMMTWSSMPSVNYQVQYTPSLQPVAWSNFNSPVSATDTNTTTQDVINRSLLMRLYRVGLILE